jgi:DNA repair protein RecO (recombination protein O)
MIQKTPSLVIRTSHYSETSVIVSLYTLEEGKVRCIAKGARRPKSPFTGKMEPLNELEAVYIHGKSDLYTLQECSIIKSRMAIREDLTRLNIALRILALLDETQADYDPNASVYHLAIECLDAIERLADSSAVFLFFRVRLLDESGYAPEYKRCVFCSKEIGRKSVYLSSKNGFLCDACSKKHRGITVSGGTMEILRKLQHANIVSALRIRLSALQQKEMDSLFRSTFESILERKSTAGKILDAIEKPFF